MPKGIGELGYIIVDCQDNERLASFWSAVLGLEIAERSHPYIDLATSADGAPVISFQQVDEPKTVKNRLHLDIKVENLQLATEKIQAIGGRLLQECFEEPFEWRVMTDPEENEFCLVIG
jgi:predicted enzyme related to lactoylglutathione lyase